VRGDKSVELMAAAARGIERNDTRLVIFDEGDSLNDDSFEVVRYLQDKTGCPILVADFLSQCSIQGSEEASKGS
jgi:DNA transposition AAA+ family ATPase